MLSARSSWPSASSRPFPPSAPSSWRRRGELAARAARVARPCDTLAALGPYRPSLLFYARRPVTFVSGRAYRDEARLAELAGRPGRLYVIAPAALAPTLPPPLSPPSG